MILTYRDILAERTGNMPLLPSSDVLTTQYMTMLIALLWPRIKLGKEKVRDRMPEEAWTNEQKPQHVANRFKTGGSCKWRLVMPSDRRFVH